MRELFIIMALTILSASAVAQDSPCLCENLESETFEPKLMGELFVYQAGLIGTEFFNIDYAKGDIVLQNGEMVHDKRLRYNGRVDGLLMLSSNDQEILLDKYFIKEFSFNNCTFRKIKVIKDFNSDTSEVYGQILYENKLSLYVFRQCVFNQDVLTYVSNHQISKQSFHPLPIFYFQLPNHKTIGFKKFKKRDLFHLFPDKKDAMRKLFREKHQHRFKSEADLIQITALLNEMINAN
jgi:hypothetical protein